MKSGPNMTPVTPSILNKFLQKNEMEMSIMTFLPHFYIHMKIKSSTAIQSLNHIKVYSHVKMYLFNDGLYQMMSYRKNIINPLQPNINIHILQIVPCIFP